MGLTHSISRAQVLSKIPKRAPKPFQGKLAPILSSCSHCLPPKLSSLSSNKNPAENFSVRVEIDFCDSFVTVRKDQSWKKRDSSDGSCSLLCDWQLLEQKNRLLLFSGEEAAQAYFIQWTEGHFFFKWDTLILPGSLYSHSPKSIKFQDQLLPRGVHSLLAIICFSSNDSHKMILCI